ncbi:hypothetical protein VSR82_20605 [Burkholderia sp. JPY481]|uniref:hypothetical protein n=1 Tax=Paraburkholderia sp. JPY465 TaxID=3042285 RepID=UPI00316EAEA5
MPKRERAMFMAPPIKALGSRATAVSLGGQPRRESGPLEDSDDGVVSYRSAHLAGALSENVIVAGQRAGDAEAIFEIRRISIQDIGQIDRRGLVCEEAEMET